MQNYTSSHRLGRFLSSSDALVYTCVTVLRQLREWSSVLPEPGTGNMPEVTTHFTWACSEIDASYIRSLIFFSDDVLKGELIVGEFKINPAQSRVGVTVTDPVGTLPILEGMLRICTSYFTFRD
jgi:hypothetical protein